MPVPVVLGNDAVYGDDGTVGCEDALAVGAFHELEVAIDVLVSVLVLARVLVGQRY